MARDVSYVFDPFEIAGVDPDELSEADKTSVLEEVSDIVLTQVLKDTSQGLSSVTGKQWQLKLNDDYAKRKKAMGGVPIANLELEGDLLQAVRIVREGDTKLKLFVESEQSDKADGHNNHSGKSKLPLRRFIPNEDDGDTFRAGINKQITKTVKEVTPNEAETAFNRALRELVEEGLIVTTRGT